MSFTQSGPQLANQYHDDRVLRAWLACALPDPLLAAMLPDLEALGDYAVQQWRVRTSEPRETPQLTQWDAWGRRVDRVNLSRTWREGASMATRYGLIAHGHDAALGEHARVAQFARVYLYHVASEFYTCPLAMTDGAATAIKAAGDEALIERAVRRFLSREVNSFWLSGQWMTETAGGSDVGNTETRARRDDSGQWRLYGRKWFTSAIVGEAALALARPEDAGEGAGALRLFYLETHDADGRWNGIRIDRLKDKLGTRELPTAEIHLDGVPAQPLGEGGAGVRMIAPMLNVTRLWNAVCALAQMRRCIALAHDYAQRRHAFGAALIDQPLHAATLADMQAEFEAAFQLVFEVARLLGRVECGEATDQETALLRLLTPLAKLWTGKLAVAIASETLECFGGAGYIENTGIPQMLRDAQIYPIWEGTTNVLSLDVLRVLDKTGLTPLCEAIEGLTENAADERPSALVRRALERCAAFIDSNADAPEMLQAGARGLALTLARSTAAALLSRNAADADARAALDLFLAHGIDCLRA